MAIHRGETIRLPHDTIRIAIQGPRYDTYRDTHYALKIKKEHDVSTILIALPGIV